MAVYIFQDNALELLGQVEGEAWMREQHDRPDSPYGFFSWLSAWRLKEATPGAQSEAVRLFMEGGDGALYGDGGYARYIVASNGELVLLGSSTRQERREKALSVGFSVR